ncbi:MAG: thiol-disulfide oxidoreductase DCC family protein [Candidatus Binatia bacterium]
MSIPAASAAGAPIVFYDGVCGLCQRTLRFLLARDRQRRFRFAALQSDFARAALAAHGREATDLDTMFLLLDPGGPGERLLEKSDAALTAVALLGGVWRLAGLARALPRGLRDAGYAVLVRNRYRVFGRFDRCQLPPPEVRDRFLDQTLADAPQRSIA